MLKTRLCTRCKSEKQVSDFHKWKHGRDGLYVWCRTCCRERQRFYRTQYMRRNISRGRKPGYGKCSYCKRIKTASNFHKCLQSRTGLYPYCKSCQNKKSKRYRTKYPEKVKERIKQWRKQTRMKALVHYSGDPPKCACCGESTYEFLTIDHINGGGNKHRKKLRKIKIGFGNEIYRWLKIAGYPPGFRILCYNCNQVIGFYGYCPHQAQTVTSSHSKPKNTSAGVAPPTPNT